VSEIPSESPPAIAGQPDGFATIEEVGVVRRSLDRMAVDVGEIRADVARVRERLRDLTRPRGVDDWGDPEDENPGGILYRIEKHVDALHEKIDAGIVVRVSLPDGLADDMLHLRRTLDRLVADAAEQAEYARGWSRIIEDLDRDVRSLVRSTTVQVDPPALRPGSTSPPWVDDA
jgi:hypothetical protein